MIRRGCQLLTARVKACGIEMHSGTLIFLLSPIILIELGLMIFSLYDLSRPERKVRGGSKLVWVLVVVLLNLVGPLLYLFIGREDV